MRNTKIKPPPYAIFRLSVINETGYRDTVPDLIQPDSSDGLIFVQLHICIINYIYYWQFNILVFLI